MLTAGVPDNLVALEIDLWISDVLCRTSHLDHGRQAERHDLRHTQPAAALENDVEVDVHDAAGLRVEQDVVQVPVAQAQQVTHLQVSTEWQSAAALLLVAWHQQAGPMPSSR